MDGHFAADCPQKSFGLPGARALRQELCAVRHELNAAQEARRDAQAAAAAAETVAPALPLLPEPKRRRMRGKQPNPYPPLDEEADQVAGPAARRWNQMSGVSLAAQSNTGHGSQRRSFQVNVAGKVVGKSKVYIPFRTWTTSDTLPCNSAECWRKPDGQTLVFCGQDVCAYAAAKACRSELLALRPDRRKRTRASEEQVVEGEAASGTLEDWSRRWLSSTAQH